MVDKVMNCEEGIHNCTLAMVSVVETVLKIVVVEEVVLKSEAKMLDMK